MKVRLLRLDKEANHFIQESQEEFVKYKNIKSRAEVRGGVLMKENKGESVTKFGGSIRRGEKRGVSGERAVFAGRSSKTHPSPLRGRSEKSPSFQSLKSSPSSDSGASGTAMSQAAKKITTRMTPDAILKRAGNSEETQKPMDDEPASKAKALKSALAPMLRRWDSNIAKDTLPQGALPVNINLHNKNTELSIYPEAIETPSAQFPRAEVRRIEISYKNLEALGVKRFAYGTQALVETREDWDFVLKLLIDEAVAYVSATETIDSYEIAHRKLNGLVPDFAFMDLRNNSGTLETAIVMRKVALMDLTTQIKEALAQGDLDIAKNLIKENIHLIIEILRRGVFSLDAKLENFGIRQSRQLLLAPGHLSETYDNSAIRRFVQITQENYNYLKDTLHSAELADFYLETLRLNGLDEPNLKETLRKIFGTGTPTPIPDISDEIVQSIEALKKRSEVGIVEDLEARAEVREEKRQRGTEAKRQRKDRRLEEIAEAIVPSVIQGRTPPPAEVGKLYGMLTQSGLKDWPAVNETFRRVAERVISNPRLILAGEAYAAAIPELSSNVRALIERMKEKVSPVNQEMALALDARLIPESEREQRDLLRKGLTEGYLVLGYRVGGGTSIETARKNQLEQKIRGLGAEVRSHFRLYSYVGESPRYEELQGKLGRDVDRDRMITLWADGSLRMPQEGKERALTFVMDPEVLASLKLGEIISILQVLAEAPPELRNFYLNSLSLAPKSDGLSYLTADFLSALARLEEFATAA